jgi:Flp pilus assembly protein TadD
MTHPWCLCLLVATLEAGPALSRDAPAAYARALSLHRAGDLEAAVKAYREAIALDPKNAEARSNLGAALAALGRYEEAIQSYREALRLAPGDARIRLNLAIAHYKSADIPVAAEELARLHTEQPADLRTTLLLADCRLQLGEYGAVESLLRPLESARPDDRTVAYLLGMALIRGGKADEGQTRVERLMRGGDSAETHYLLGSASFMAGNYPQAVVDLSKALTLNPRLPSLRSYYGRALLFTGDAEGAERALREVLTEEPNDYEANYFLASILATRGRPAEARPLVERALQLRPQSEEARTLRASLDRPSAPAPPGGDASPLVGTPAPDVELRRADGGTFRLSSLVGQPLLLAFGSYTCPQLRHGAPVLNRLYERYRGRVRFMLVYIREAHPQGESWQSTVNEREGVSVPEARNEAERGEHASLCRKRLAIPYEAVVDGMDGLAEAAFQAFPSRAFVIDKSGRVAFATTLDVESLRPEGVEAALEGTLR